MPGTFLYNPDKPEPKRLATEATEDTEVKKISLCALCDLCGKNILPESGRILLQGKLFASGGQGAFLKNRPLDPQKTFYYFSLFYLYLFYPTISHRDHK